MGKKKAESSAAMVIENQTGFPEFLKDVPAVQQAQAEILDMKNLSKRLDSATDYIKKETGSAMQCFCRIGYKLWEVRENKLYLGQGFKNIYEYGEIALGYQKSTIANYIAISERFSVHEDGKPTAQLSGDFASFSYSQLSLMLSMPDENLKQVKPDVTCREIREMKRTDKQKGSAGDEDTPETTSQASAEQAQETPPDTVQKTVLPKTSSLVVFERVLVKEAVSQILKLLEENIGREMQIVIKG